MAVLPDGGNYNKTPPGLEQFMQSLGQLESGNNYQAVGPQTASYGRARGRWQVMEKIYPAWAREAGVDPTDFSPAAQDRVVRKKMTDYYNRYGSWDLVAVAWFAGPGRADRAKKQGIASVGQIKDVLGTSVSKYVQKVMAGMQGGAAGRAPENPRQADLAQGVGSASQRRPSRWAPTDASPDVMAMTAPTQPEQEDPFGPEGMGQILDTISEAARGRGGQVLDLRGFLGMPAQAEPTFPTFTQPPAPTPEPEIGDEQPDPENPRQADGPMAAPPKHDGFERLSDSAKTGTQQLMGAFGGLRFTSGYRDPKRNAAAGGVKNSKHLTGQASDFVGTEEEMQQATSWAKARGAKTLIHDSGSGRHLHIEWP